MSESYEIDGVTITPQGGGFYELTHPGLPEPVKERGKENADNRARAIAAALSPGDDTATMDAQGDASLTVPSADREAETTKDEQIAKLQAQLAQSEAEKEQLEKVQTRTVQATAGAAPLVSGSKIPAGVPRQFKGVLDDKAKAEMKRLGIETTEIILEESDDIPPTGLFVGHNGRGYMISPGVPVTVPNFILGVLDDAVMASPVVDNTNKKVIGYRNRSRYPYRKL